MTPNLDASVAFYTALLGWTVTTTPAGTVVFSDAHAMRASAMAIPKGAPAPPHWLSTIAAHDIDATTARIEALGGRVMHPPTDVPGMGRFSVAADPTGAAFALWRDASLDAD